MKKQYRQLLSTPFLAALGRAGGIIIPLFVAFYYGAGRQSDAFFFAFGLIIALAGLFTPIFETLLVPFLVEVKHSAEKVSSITNGVLVLSLPGALVLFLVIWFLLGPVLPLVSGMDKETSHLTARLFIEMLPLFLFWVLTAASTSVFHTHKVFWYPALSPLIRSLTVIFLMIAAHSVWGIHTLSGGMSFGEIARWGIAMLLLIRFAHWKPKIDWAESRKRIKSFMGQALYLVFAMLALNFVPITDQWFASWLRVGDLSLISYADRLFQIPYQLALAGFLVVFLSYWSESYIRDSSLRFWMKARRDIRVVFMVSVILSGVLILLRRPVVEIIFGFGGLDVTELDNIKDLFTWLMLGFAPAILTRLYVRILFVLKKTHIFMMLSCVHLGLNILFNFIFMHLWGLIGLAISTSFVTILSTTWLHVYIKGLSEEQ